MDGSKTVSRNVAVLAMIAFTFLTPIDAGQASGKPHDEHSIANELRLSSNLEAMLNREMQAIETGMMKIIPASASGDWETLETIAVGIEDSFILKQELTREQMAELHHSLPVEFVEMDREFHSTAGKLAHAAHERDSELVSFYFYRLHSQCAQCHVKFATRRFPDLSAGRPGDGDHH